MKKLCALLLILVLLPVVSLADPTIDFFSGYAHVEIFPDGTPVMYMIYFHEDHTCYFLVQAFNASSPGPNRAHVGHWEYGEGGHVLAQTSEFMTTDFSIIEAVNGLVDTGTMQAYHPFSVQFK